MGPLNELAVIIPVGPDDHAWQALLPDLACLPDPVEILLVGTCAAPQNFSKLIKDLDLRQNVKWLTSPKGRAIQLNRGARETKKNFLWFLHADSRVDGRAVNALERCLSREENALHYFDLRFLNDAPQLTRINTIGVWVRSHWMGLPFGDQGFCLSRALFERLGAFKEKATYGEDHLLVWAAHQAGVPVHCTGASIQTSARRYGEKGWGRATARTMWLTARQALPELGKLLRKRAGYAKT